MLTVQDDFVEEKRRSSSTDHHHHLHHRSSWTTTPAPSQPPPSPPAPLPAPPPPPPRPRLNHRRIAIVLSYLAREPWRISGRIFRSHCGASFWVFEVWLLPSLIISLMPSTPGRCEEDDALGAGASRRRCSICYMEYFGRGRCINATRCPRRRCRQRYGEPYLMAAQGLWVRILRVR